MTMTQQRVQPKRVRQGRCYLYVEQRDGTAYRVCVLRVLAAISEQYEVSITDYVFSYYVFLQVYFIDNGVYGSVEAASLLEIPISLINIPSLALHCSIYHIVPSGGTWDDKGIQFFSRLLLGNTVTITVKVIG